MSFSPSLVLMFLWLTALTVQQNSQHFWVLWTAQLMSSVALNSFFFSRSYKYLFGKLLLFPLKCVKLCHYLSSLLCPENVRVMFISTCSFGITWYIFRLLLCGNLCNRPSAVSGVFLDIISFLSFENFQLSQWILERECVLCNNIFHIQQVETRH